MSEQRVARRYAVSWLVYLKVHGRQVPARTVNISLTGVRFRTRHRLKVGDTLEVDVLPTFRTFFRCRILITYAAKDGSLWGTENCYGAQFKQMSPRDLELLQTSLDALRRASNQPEEPTDFSVEGAPEPEEPGAFPARVAFGPPDSADGEPSGGSASPISFPF